MTRKHNHIVLIAALAFSALAACKNKQKTASPDLEKQGYVKAVVKDYELDGCRFMIFLDETRKLEPDWLPKEMQADSVPVWVRYERDERLSICMAGETVKVIDIKKR